MPTKISLNQLLDFLNLYQLAKNFRIKKFSKKYGSVTHNFIRASSTMPKYRKELMIQFLENAQTDRMDGRMEGQTNRIS